MLFVQTTDVLAVEMSSFIHRLYVNVQILQDCIVYNVAFYTEGQINPLPMYDIPVRYNDGKGI